MLQKFKSKPSFNYVELKGLQKYVKDTKGFIAGGCFKDLFLGKKLRDVDVFFQNEEDYNEAVQIYNTKCGHKKSDLKKIYTNDNCTGYRNSKTGINIELVKSIFGTPETIISQFDFTIVKVAYFNPPSEEQDTQFIYHPDFFEHLTLKRLVIDEGMPKPVATLNRTWKYAKYGFGLCRESKIKLTNEVIEKGIVDDINGDLYFGFD
jgi:hypothetical protein